MDNDVPAGPVPPAPSPSAPPPVIPHAPVYPPLPQPRASRGGRGWIWLVVGGFAVIALITVFLFVAALGHTGGSTKMIRVDGSWLEEVVVEDNNSDYKIAIIDVRGIITGEAIDPSGASLVTLIKDQLQRAGEDSDVKAVLLKVDSPGGEVLASDDIYRAIQKFQEKSGKPVVASMGSLAASGGYYVSAPCRWIVANELSLTGSIGVIMSGYNVRGLMDKVGVHPEVYKSGKHKDMMSWSRNPDEITAEEREMMQALIDETFGRFKEVVSEGRKYAARMNKSSGRDLASGWERLADGRILSGKQAFEHGFVDELGTLETAVKRAKTIAGIPNANLVHYQQPFNFGSLFRLFGQSETKSIKVDLGVEFPKLRPGCMYFIMPTATQ